MRRAGEMLSHVAAVVRGGARALAPLVAVLAVSGRADADGRIVLAHDVNTLATNRAGAAETRFALNVAEWLCYGKPGRILLVQAGADPERDYAPVVVQALQRAGYGVVITDSAAWTAKQLAEFDAVFVGIIFGGYSSIPADELAAFVTAGGGVYCFGGVGGLAAPEADALNSFAVRYDLSFSGTYNFLSSVAINSSHPIFNGVPTLSCVWGQDIAITAPRCGVSIVQRNETGGGVYAVVDTATVIVDEPGPATTCRSGEASFTVNAGGAGPLSYQWQWQPAGTSTAWVALTAGDNADVGGAPVVNASGVQGNVLRVRPLPAYLATAPRAFRCAVTGGCAGVTSAAAVLTVCPADFDCNGSTTGDDFDAFVAAFERGDISADIDANGFVNGDDFDAFIAGFENGC